ncbi:MAG: isopenicillin N synthase family oxygenase [Symploca sp. SIO2E6]|nr:isopenicillin N synthase family oxygenase [Symploca sp. SIO2E6]
MLAQHLTPVIMESKREHNWMKARLDQGSLVFDQENGLQCALEDGFFFVEYPGNLDFSPGDRFARSFYLPDNPDKTDPYRGFSLATLEYVGKYDGYHRCDGSQTEQFFLESRSWNTVFPLELSRQAVAMQEFALDILRAVLVHLDLPQELWDEATGGCLSARGTYHLSFNHYRPEVPAPGFNTHKDTSWMSVLRSPEPGLEVQLGNIWYPIEPIPRTLMVIFGCAMEILTKPSRTPVTASTHRVVEQTQTNGKPDRFSYGLFVDSSLDETICPGLYCYEPGKGLVLVGKVEDAINQFIENVL